MLEYKNTNMRKFITNKNKTLTKKKRNRKLLNTKTLNSKWRHRKKADIKRLKNSTKFMKRLTNNKWMCMRNKLMIIIINNNRKKLLLNLLTIKYIKKKKRQLIPKSSKLKELKKIRKKPKITLIHRKDNNRRINKIQMLLTLPPSTMRRQSMPRQTQVKEWALRSVQNQLLAKALIIWKKLTRKRRTRNLSLPLVNHAIALFSDHL